MSDTLVTRDTLAAIFTVDVRTVKNLVDEGMPKAARGKFDLALCVPWYLERERERVRAGKGLNDLDLARQRKTVAEARLAEINLAKAEELVIPTELHVDRLTQRLDTVAGAVKAMGRYQADVKGAITDEAADRLLDRMSDEILAELYALSDAIE